VNKDDGHVGSGRCKMRDEILYDYQTSKGCTMADEFKSTAPKPFVFVLMPFAAEFNDIYTFGIKGAVDEAGGYAERLDEQIFAENILERLYNQINKADVIVADMTGRNPNVFYEVGYAHALGKIVLLLTKNTDDIPFDLKHYPHIVYGGSIGQIRSELVKRVAWAINESKKPIGVNNAEKISLEINGVEIIECSLRNITSAVKVRTSDMPFIVNICNTGLASINNELQMYLITNNTNSKIIKSEIIPPSIYRIFGDNTRMYDLGIISNLSVGSIKELRIRIHHASILNEIYRYQIVVNSNSKQYVFPFLVETPSNKFVYDDEITMEDYNSN
jgi:Nucleoside 2-deoxyribosyltransferase